MLCAPCDGERGQSRETVMAKIISFPASARKADNGVPVPGTDAQVILFSGVRYEYLSDEPTARPSGSRCALRPAGSSFQGGSSQGQGRRIS